MSLPIDVMDVLKTAGPFENLPTPLLHLQNLLHKLSVIDLQYMGRSTNGWTTPINDSVPGGPLIQ